LARLARALDTMAVDELGASGPHGMSGHIDQFREDLRSNILGVAASFSRFNALVQETTGSTEQELREQLARMDALAQITRGKAAAAYAEFDRWMENEKLQAEEKIAEWKKTRQTGQLHARADRFERCAVTAVEIAMLAIDEAERTVIRAILARKEAISVQVQRIDGD
jgi:hypothetical protein